MSDAFSVEDVVAFGPTYRCRSFCGKSFHHIPMQSTRSRQQSCTQLYIILQVIADVRWCREIICNGRQGHATVEDIIIEDYFDTKHFVVIFSEVGRSVEMRVGEILKALDDEFNIDIDIVTANTIIMKSMLYVLGLI